MVKFCIYALIIILAALYATLFLDVLNNPGYVLFSWGNYTLETSLLALTVMLITLIILWRLLFLILYWLNPWRLVRYFRRDRVNVPTRVSHKSQGSPPERETVEAANVTSV